MLASDFAPVEGLRSSAKLFSHQVLRSVGDNKILGQAKVLCVGWYRCLVAVPHYTVTQEVKSHG